MKKVEIADSVDTDEMNHIEPPHLDLHCFTSFNSQYGEAWMIFFLILQM